jgi:hypothetical protein
MNPMRKVLFILPHQGLGDLLICNGIFREAAKERKLVLIAVKKSNARQVKVMLQDVTNIRLLSFPDHFESRISLLASFVSQLNFDILKLGHYGSNFIPDGVRFDQSFYNQAGVSHELRWDGFFIPRDIKKELLLYSILVCDQPYAFLHEDRTRGMVINRDLISSDCIIVEPLPKGSEFTVFDYLTIIENASEIHVIESSFAHLIESVGIQGKKIAHRYTRPLVMNDFRQTPTYRNKWRVITSELD